MVHCIFLDLQMWLYYWDSTTSILSCLCLRCSLLDRRANKKRSERDWSYVSNELPNELKYWRSPFMAIDNFRFSMGEEDTEGDSRIQHRSTSWLFCWAQRRQSLPLGFHHHRPTRCASSALHDTLFLFPNHNMVHDACMVYNVTIFLMFCRISIPRGNILSWHHISTWLSFQASQGIFISITIHKKANSLSLKPYSMGQHFEKFLHKLKVAISFIPKG